MINGKTATNVLIFAGLFAFLFSEIPPSLILSPTTVSGGDLSSHYAAFIYFRNELLAHGKLMGWDPGSFAGYPLFYLYFPLPYLIAAALSLLFPLQIAFKITSLLGIFLLPISAYFFLWKLRTPFPGPILGAAFSLIFLFNEGNSIWGGNLGSTLSGEFCYSLGLAFGLSFLGVIYSEMSEPNSRLRRVCERMSNIVTFSQYSDLEERRQAWRSALLLTATGLCHPYVVLAFGSMALFLLVMHRENFSQRLWYFVRVYALAFFLSAFWIVPVLFYSPYNTGQWSIWNGSFTELMPVVLYPMALLALVNLFFAMREKVLDPRVTYLLSGMLISLAFVLTSPFLGAVGIRFLPFIQLDICLLAAIACGKILENKRGRAMLSLALAASVITWSSSRIHSLEGWVRWNYEGLEAKANYGTLTQIMRMIKGSISDPRVVDENTSLNDGLGTPRIFELIPFLSGRATLGGVYFNSTLTSPFFYWLQGEYSPDVPTVSYEWANFYYDPINSADDLKLFNVKQILARTDKLSTILSKGIDFRRIGKIEHYNLFEVIPGNGDYVEPLQFKPMYCEEKKWKQVAFRWFRLFSRNHVFVVFRHHLSLGERNLFAGKLNPASFDLVRIPYASPCEARSKLETDTLHIQTNCIGRPLLIKVSYHPGWTVEGADKIYLISPSFMMVIPQSQTITLRFKPSLPEKSGVVLSLLGLGLLFLRFPGVPRIFYRADRFVEKHHAPILISVALSLLVLSTFAGFYCRAIDPTHRYDYGIILKQRGEFLKAENVFHQLILDHPERYESSNAAFEIGMCELKQGHRREAKKAFQYFLKWYPKAGYAENARETLKNL